MYEPDLLGGNSNIYCKLQFHKRTCTHSYKCGVRDMTSANFVQHTLNAAHP